jgi:hypothetical protein
VRLPRSGWIDVGVKAAFVLLVAYGAVSGEPQFEGKGFGWRLLAAPVFSSPYRPRGRCSGAGAPTRGQPTRS